MSQGQNVCPDCMRNLTRALHEPGCPTVAREREAEQAAMTQWQRWFEGLRPGEPVEVNEQWLTVRHAYLQLGADGGTPHVVLKLDLPEGTR